MVFSATVLYMAVNSFSLASLEEYTKMTWHVADLGMVISRLTICCSTNELKDNTGGNTSLTGSWVVGVGGVVVVGVGGVVGVVGVDFAGAGSFEGSFEGCSFEGSVATIIDSGSGGGGSTLGFQLSSTATTISSGCGGVLS